MRLSAIERKHATLLREVDALVRPIVELVPVDTIAEHNAGYRAHSGDPFYHLITAQRLRYVHALEALTAQGSQRGVLDLGTFIPYLPLLLKRVGFDVTIVDRYDLYGDEFRAAIVDLAESNGLELRNRDILDGDLSALGRHDVVLLMAVVEHLSGSPRGLMEQVRGLIKDGGSIVLEVPNIADLLQRLRLLLGRSPLGPYSTYLDSAYPYMGHNREMTVAEVRYLLEATGFEVDALYSYDFAPPVPETHPKARLLTAIKRLSVRNARQVVFAQAHPHSAGPAKTNLGDFVGSRGSPRDTGTTDHLGPI